MMGLGAGIVANASSFDQGCNVSMMAIRLVVVFQLRMVML